MLSRTTLLLALVGACTARAAHPIPIAVLELGERSAIGALPNQVDGLAPHEVALPAPTPRLEDDVTAILTRARTAYVRGELELCRDEVAHLSIAKLLGDADRARASRALALDIACASGATLHAVAVTEAERFATYGLDLAESTVAPDVEALIGSAVEKAGVSPRHPLAIEAVPGAQLVVDGRPAGCASPCTLDLAAGEHVIAASADGYVAALQVVRVPDLARVKIEQAAANAELAAQQWRARSGRGLPSTDLVGAMLIGRFVPEQRVAVIHGDAKLFAELVVGGNRVATNEGPRGDPSDLLRELAYDGGVLHRPAVWQRPWFWIAVSGAVLVIAGGIVALTYTPPTHTGVGF